MHRRNYTEY